MFRKLLAPLVLLLGLVVVPVAFAADYTPTAAETAEIDRLTGAYYRAIDAGQYEAAYAMQTPELQATMAFAEWRDLLRETEASVGRPLSRQRTKVTWYLDPPNSPQPGLYVAVDFASSYAKAPQAGEYVVWFRGRDDWSFRLMRHEQTSVLDTKLKTLPAPEPLPETPGNSIAYATVEEARNDLTSRKDVEIRPMEDGWLVVNVPSDNAVWSFAPPGHPAYPAAVKRFVFERDGSVMMAMSALCQAAKEPCDALMREFQELNQQAADAARK